MEPGKEDALLRDGWDDTCKVYNQVFKGIYLYAKQIGWPEADTAFFAQFSVKVQCEQGEIQEFDDIEPETFTVPSKILLENYDASEVEYEVYRDEAIIGQLCMRAGEYLKKIYDLEEITHDGSCEFKPGSAEEQYGYGCIQFGVKTAPRLLKFEIAYPRD